MREQEIRRDAKATGIVDDRAARACGHRRWRWSALPSCDTRATWPGRICGSRFMPRSVNCDGPLRPWQICGRSTNPGKVAIPGGGGSDAFVIPAKKRGPAVRGDAGARAACRPACPSTSCRAKSLPRRHGRPPGQAAGPPDGHLAPAIAGQSGERSATRAVGLSARMDFNTEHGEGHGGPRRTV